MRLKVSNDSKFYIDDLVDGYTLSTKKITLSGKKIAQKMEGDRKGIYN